MDLKRDGARQRSALPEAPGKEKAHSGLFPFFDI
nr:MAG TPA: hypothetical protein [Caudoviricetes sp.]